MGAIEKIQALGKRYVDEGNQLLIADQEQNFKKLFRESVRSFYGAYSPAEYHRRYSLYKMGKFEVASESILIHVGGEYSPIGHRVDNDYIYTNSFVKGFHGGAISGQNHPSPGVPYWRTPKPHYPYWGRPAASSDSPEEKFGELWDAYLQGPYEKYFQRMVAFLKKKYEEELTALIVELVLEKIRQKGGK